MNNARATFQDEGMQSVLESRRFGRYEMHCLKGGLESIEHAAVIEPELAASVVYQ